MVIVDVLGFLCDPYVSFDFYIVVAAAVALPFFFSLHMAKNKHQQKRQQQHISVPMFASEAPVQLHQRNGYFLKSLERRRVKSI